MAGMGGRDERNRFCPYRFPYGDQDALGGGEPFLSLRVPLYGKEAGSQTRIRFCPIPIPYAAQKRFGTEFVSVPSPSLIRDRNRFCPILYSIRDRNELRDPNSFLSHPPPYMRDRNESRDRNEVTGRPALPALPNLTSNGTSYRWR